MTTDRARSLFFILVGASQVITTLPERPKLRENKPLMQVKYYINQRKNPFCYTNTSSHNQQNEQQLPPSVSHIPHQISYKGRHFKRDIWLLCVFSPPAVSYGGFAVHAEAHGREASSFWTPGPDAGPATPHCIMGHHRLTRESHNQNICWGIYWKLEFLCRVCFFLTFWENLSVSA